MFRSDRSRYESSTRGHFSPSLVAPRELALSALPAGRPARGNRSDNALLKSRAPQPGSARPALEGKDMSVIARTYAERSSEDSSSISSRVGARALGVFGRRTFMGWSP